jgi:hypothetical protein
VPSICRNTTYDGGKYSVITTQWNFIYSNTGGRHKLVVLQFNLIIVLKFTLEPLQSNHSTTLNYVEGKLEIQLKNVSFSIE